MVDMIRLNYNSVWTTVPNKIYLNLNKDDDNDDKCTVIVSVMQKNRRAQRKSGIDSLTIGFTIYHVSSKRSMDPSQ
jgi:calpain